MIAAESIREFRTADIAALFVLACLQSLFTYPFEEVFREYFFLWSILVWVFLVAFGAQLTKRAGSAVILSVMSSILTWGVDDLGVHGWRRLIIFVLSALVFEIVFIILKVEYKNVSFDVIAASALAGASIPLMMILVMSPQVGLNMGYDSVNLSLASLFAGIVGATLSFILWFELRAEPFVIRYQYLHTRLHHSYFARRWWNFIR